MRSLKSTLHGYIFLLAMAPGCAQAQTPAPMPLQLSQAIDLALRQNRSLHLAELSVTGYRHKKDAARSAYFPRITNYSEVHHITELAGVAIPAGAFGSPASTGPIPAKTLFLDQGAATSYTSGTQLEQPLSQIFKIRESNRAAAADVETAKVQLTQTENAIALEARKLYCDLLVAQIKLQAAQEQMEAVEVKHGEDVDAVAKGHALEVVALESQASLLQARHSVLTEEIAMHDAMLTLNDLLGLPLETPLQLDSDVSALTVSVPTREESLRIARQKSPAILAGRQALTKAKAGLGAAKDAYIPNITGLARYSYQSGIPLLVHNFGTFGFNFSYDLFDGGRRVADIKDAQTVLDEAKMNLDQITDEVDVRVESAYDGLEQAADLLHVAQEALNVRTEAARLADRQFEQTEALASTRSAAHADLASAKSSLVEATLGLALAQASLKQTIGELPR